MVLALLLGNTSVRHGVFHHARLLCSGAFLWQDLPRRREEISRLLEAYPAEQVVIASVRDDRLSEVTACLPAGLPPVHVARRDFPLPIENRYEDPDEVGTDRLLNAIAARGRAGRRGAVVVDFGTAISFTVVGPAGDFLGGLIAAGSAVLFSGLRQVTPCLPRVDSLAPDAYLQRSTGAALRSGLYWQIVGGVRTILRGLLDELSFQSPLVLATGGGAPLLASRIAEIEEVVPDLTLEGLMIAWESRQGAGRS